MVSQVIHFQRTTALQARGISALRPALVPFLESGILCAPRRARNEGEEAGGSLEVAERVGSGPEREDLS